MIRIGFYTPPVILSSDLQDVHISSDHDYVDVRLTADGLELLSGRYYLLDGAVFVSDLRELIEQHISGNTDINFCDCRLDAFVGEDETDLTSIEFRVLYCDMITGLYDPSEWLKANFLTLAPFQRIAPEGFIELRWYSTAPEEIALCAYCTYLDPEGQRGTYVYVISGNGMTAHFDAVFYEFVYVRDIVRKLCEARHLDSLTLQSVTFRVGERSITYFIDRSLSGIYPFRFFNCFNILEQLPLRCATTAKIKADRPVASLGNSSQFYDCTVSKEYEVETAPLSADEMVLIEQMMTSSSVRIQAGPEQEGYIETDFDAMREILITDFTSELSDSGDKLNTVKFTWRFADNLPMVVIPTSPGIFNDKFNPVFS